MFTILNFIILLGRQYIYTCTTCKHNTSLLAHLRSYLVTMQRMYSCLMAETNSLPRLSLCRIDCRFFIHSANSASFTVLQVSDILFQQKKHAITSLVGTTFFPLYSTFYDFQIKHRVCTIWKTLWIICHCCTTRSA